MPRGDPPRGRARDAGYPPPSDDERPLGRDDIARAAAFEIAVARGAAEAELAVASAEAQAAEARLLAAQRRYSIFTATDPPAADSGAGSSQTPTAASEACARGALLARTAQPERRGQLPCAGYAGSEIALYALWLQCYHHCQHRAQLKPRLPPPHLSLSSRVQCPTALVPPERGVRDCS